MNDWLASINWTDDCLDCQAKHGGVCHSMACAHYFYDPWGDPFPDYVYHFDGNSIQQYIEAKRKQMRW